VTLTDLSKERSNFYEHRIIAINRTRNASAMLTPQPL
jgi:hypothetical protein